MTRLVLQKKLITLAGILVFCIGCERESAPEATAPAEHRQAMQENAPSDIPNDENVLSVAGSVDFDAGYSLDLTDEQVEDLRGKLKAIRFPQLEGTTSRILDLPQSKSRTEVLLSPTDILPDEGWQCTDHCKQWWMLNSRYRLTIAQGRYVNAHSERIPLETRVLITENIPSALTLYSPGKLDEESVMRASATVE